MSNPQDASSYVVRFNQIGQQLEYVDGLVWRAITGISGITQLTGDVTAGPGSGSVVATLVNVNANVGSFTNTNLTVNAKGLITAASNGGVIAPGGMNTAVQYNNSGAFGGDAALLSWNESEQTLTVVGKSDDSSDFTSTALELSGGLLFNSITNAGPPFGTNIAGMCIRNTASEAALGANCFVVRSPGFLIENPVLGGGGPWAFLVSAPNSNILLGDPFPNPNKFTYVVNNKLEVMGNLYIGAPQNSTGVAVAPTNGIQVAGAIRYMGSTSGTVDIVAPATPTTYVLTLPPNAGSNGQVLTTDGSGTSTWTTVSGGGGSLNLTQGSTTTDTLISGTTLTATTLSGSITPSASSSKVLVTITGTVRFTSGSASPANQFASLAIYRGVTQIFIVNRCLGFGFSNANDSWVPYSLCYLDSPATTSATTYSLQAAGVNNGGTPVLEFQDDNDPATITLMEVPV